MHSSKFNFYWLKRPRKESLITYTVLLATPCNKKAECFVFLDFLLYFKIAFLSNECTLYVFLKEITYGFTFFFFFFFCWLTLPFEITTSRGLQTFKHFAYEMKGLSVLCCNF